MTSSAPVPGSQRDYVSLVATVGSRNLPPGGEEMLERVRDLVQDRLRTPLTVLVDLGCNTGWVTSWLHSALAADYSLGVDLSSKMIDVASRRFGGDHVEFRVADAAALDTVVPECDMVVCAGSSAFFASLELVYGAVARLTHHRGAIFLDLIYQHDLNYPEALREAEAAEFGVGTDHRTAAYWLSHYEAGGLILDLWERRNRWQVPEGPAAAVYRQALGRVAGMDAVIKRVTSRQALATRLSQYRHPALVLLDQAAPPTPQEDRTAGGDPSLLDRFVTMAAMWREPIARLGLGEIAALLPSHRLTYFGLGAPAPGGGAAVADACRLMDSLGVRRDGVLLDVGCESGHSTLIASQWFPFAVGIDVLPMAVIAGRRMAERTHSTATFELTDAALTGRADGEVAAVMLNASLGYMPNPQEALMELCRIMADDGVLVEFLYDYRSGESVGEILRERVSPYVRPSRLSDQVAAFEDAGFELVHAERRPRSLRTDPGQRASLVDRVADEELRANQSMSSSDWAALRALIAEVVLLPNLGDAEPHVYLAAFRKGRRQ